MEFWGVEVKPGQTVKCDIEEGKLLHLSQAALGESKKGVESVSIFVKFNDQKLVVGTLSQEKCAQIQYDLVFEKEFDLSHSSKNASVYFCGYKTTLQDDSPSGEEDFSGKIVKKERAKMKMAKDENDEDGAVEMTRKMFMYKANDEGDDDDDDEEEEEDSEDGVDDEVKAIFDSDDEDDDDDGSSEEEKEVTRKNQINAIFDNDDDESSEEEEEVTPKKVKAIFDSDDEDDDDDDGSSEEVEEVTRKNLLKIFFDSDDESSEEEEEVTLKKAAVSGKKRPAASASKTPATEKKVKLISPAGQKTGGSGRKGAHTATPHPAKIGKTLANNDKSKQQTPKYAGSVTCKSCSKSFNSDNALKAHTKAKHSPTN